MNLFYFLLLLKFLLYINFINLITLNIKKYFIINFENYVLYNFFYFFIYKYIFYKTSVNQMKKVNYQ